MRSRIVTSALLPAIALPGLALGHGGHPPALPGLGITRAVHFVTSTVGSITSPRAASTRRHQVKRHGPHTSVRYVVINCRGNALVRPSAFQLACADGDDYLSGLRWTAWSPGYASAGGTQVVNTCAPSCARGKFRGYPVRVILWGSAGHGGVRRYTMITLLYTGREPSVGSGSAKMAGPPSVTGNLWS
jgi:hypothetical protein